MGNIIIKDREGITHKLEAKAGYKLMEIIRDAGLDIEAACGGCCACATCHVYISEKWYDKLNTIEEEEESMLDQAFNIKNTSRLSCQIEYEEKLDGIELTLAED